MLNSKIEWCDHTVNFWWGCRKVSPGCTNCYAESLDKRFHGGEHWGAGKYMPRLEKAREECLRIERRAVKDGKPVKVFVNSMSDWLDPDVPIEWLADMMDVIRRCEHVTFLLLSKRIENWHERIGWLRDFVLISFEPRDFRGKSFSASERWKGRYPKEVEAIESCTDAEHKARLDRWIAAGDLACGWLSGESECAIEDGKFYSVWNYPKNVWIGATVENQPMADKRIPELLQIPAQVHFISCEPMLGSLDLDFFFRPLAHIPGNEYGWTKGIDWVICGGESGPNARPMHPDWVRSMRDQSKAAGVPFFFKSWGEWSHDDPQSDVLELEKTAYFPDCGDVNTSVMLNEMTPERIERWCDGDTEDVVVYRVGKARAGRLLDGVEHREFPALREASHD